MRMGAFLLGGVVGAAAVVYYMRGKHMSFAGLTSQTSDMFSKPTSSKPVKFASSSSHSDKFSSSSNSSRSESGLGQVEELIAQDAAVKSQVDEILNKSASSYMTQ
ncbi:hypothetical protein [Paenibacillus oceani]|uniref:Uncharacterized protein n=1 Tax=Paenibacillus oceani TaxID=2772510 RepID=A0A927C7C6_9BACL|nr:hypothetical protein [Paenibacillus oceani]MBD2861342.1 hypothetical protein [Paenibacillus oceani]